MMFFIERIKRAFNWSKKAAFIQKRTLFSLPRIWTQLIYYRLRYKISAQNYVNYCFWENSHEKVRHHFTEKDNVYLVETVNDQSKIHLLRDKLILLNRMGTALGRDYMDIQTVSPDGFHDFFKNHKKIIVKPRSAAGGKGIRVIEGPLKYEDAETLRIKLIEEGSTLAEEFVDQHPEMSRIYPHAVNIIKIHTLNIGEEINIVLPQILQFGANGNQISHGGFSVPINEDTGTIYVTKYLKEHLLERIPWDLLEERPIPYFHEALDFAKKLAEKVPELVYICWDIGISRTGPVVLEGNGASSAYEDCQKYYYAKTGLGGKDFYDEILFYCQKRANLTDESVRAIQQTLYYETTGKDRDLDGMIVLGSTYCKYRIEQALRYAKGKKNIIYLVSGQGECKEIFRDGNPGFITESSYMAEYLIRKGIDPSNILLENHGRSTSENLKYSLSLLDKNYSRFRKEGKPCIGIVTAGFHMKRIFDLLNAHPSAANYEWVSLPAYGSHTGKNSWYKNPKGLKIILNEFAKCQS